MGKHGLAAHQSMRFTAIFDALVKNGCMLQIHIPLYGCSLIARVLTLYLRRQSFSKSELSWTSSQPLMAGRQAALEDENTSVRPIEESMGCKVFSEQQTPAQNGLKRRLP
jgi:hypothetical protein